METQEYKVKAPDGQIIKLRGPAGASQDEVIAQAQRLYAQQQQASQAPAAQPGNQQPAPQTPQEQPAPAAQDQITYPSGMPETVQAEQAAALQAPQQPAQEDPGLLSKIGNLITGNDRETRATQELPELQNSGLLHGIDIPEGKKAAVAAAMSTMTNPEEIAKTLQSISPQIGIQQDEKGNLIAANNATGARAVINKPGFSGLDALQALGLGALFTPAGRVAGAVGGGILKQAATLGAGSALTQAAIEGGQSAAGGEFNPEDVAISGAVGAAVPVASAAIGAGVTAAQRAANSLSDAAGEAISKSKIASNLASEGQKVPEKDMLAAIKAQQEASSTENVAQAVANSATASGKKQIPTLERLADEVRPDETILKAAERLGIKDQLIPSQYSRSQAYREIEQGIASIPGSQLNAQQKQAATMLAQKTDDLIKKYGGDVDKAAVSDEFKSKGLSLINGLEEKSDELYKKVGDVISPSTPVQAGNAANILKSKADDLGGVEYLSPIERRVLKAVNSEPTYGRLDLIRRQVGEGLRGRGPFKDSESGSLKRLYGALSDDQQEAANDLGAGELFSAAKQLVASRKSIEDNLAAALGKDLTGALSAKTGNAVKALGSGNFKDFDKIMSVIPPDMQQRVVMTSLNDAFTAGSRAEKQLSAPGFVDWYEGLSRNKGAKERLTKYLPKEAASTLDDIFQVARGMRNASKERITTGRIQALMDNFATDGGMLAKLYGIGKQVAVAEGAGSALGVPGAGTAGVIARMMGKEKTPIMKAADSMMNSSLFKNVLREAAKKGPDSEIGSAESAIRKTGAYKRWLSQLAPDDQTLVQKSGLVQWLAQPVNKDGETDAR